MLVTRELEALRGVTGKPARPYVLIMGGVRVSEKIGMLRNMILKVDAILIGGAMAYTFLKARGAEIGKSRFEADTVSTARELESQAERKGVELLLPIDHVVASAPQQDAVAEIVTAIPADKMALDIGPRTIAKFIARIKSANTIVWNGPLGYFELAAFAAGTHMVGEAIALSGAISVLAGGATEAAVANEAWASRFTHISAGGGATLEFLEGRALPGLVALEEK